MATSLINPIQPPQIRRYFVGFSTQNSARTGIRTLYDIDLVNIDLTTAFMTRVGERVMRPDWGCKLWDWLMEPFTQLLVDEITTEVLRICSLDSRLSVVNEVVQITPINLGYTIAMTLVYQPWLVSGTFTQTFVQSDMAYYGENSNANLITTSL